MRQGWALAVVVGLGWYWVGEGEVSWASELHRQAGALHVLSCRAFSRTCSSFTHCLQCFDAVHYKLWSDVLALHYLIPLTVWYVDFFPLLLLQTCCLSEHVIAASEEACGSHCLCVCPVWLLLHIPAILRLVLSPNSIGPVLPVQEMTIIGARARFFKQLLSLLWQVWSHLVKHQPLHFTLLLAWTYPLFMLLELWHQCQLEIVREMGLFPHGHCQSDGWEGALFWKLGCECLCRWLFLLMRILGCV